MSRITISEAISYFDAQCPNQYSQEDKIKWLSELDEQIFNDIISKREDPIEDEFRAYTDEDLEKKLLVETPNTEIYRYWLEKSVDYANREMSAFNNAMTMYNTYYDNYLAYYNTRHRDSMHYRYILY